MTQDFSEKETGKKVMNDNGMAIGTVAKIEENTAFVETEPGIIDSIRAALGQKQHSENTIRLNPEDIQDITEKEIHLGGEISSSGGDTEEDTKRREADVGQRSVGATASSVEPEDDVNE